ncbi:MAG: nuclear transport factor 2 family protein [Flavobacteriaceae bacterium]
MKTLKILIFFINTTGLFAQEKDFFVSEEINLKMSQINEALMEKDTASLAILLHDNLTLGHSNGWLETKSGLLKTLVEEGVIYTFIETIDEPEIHFTSEKITTTRRTINVSGIVNDTPFDVKLNVLEVWILQNNHWQLLARQSVNKRE